MSHSLTSDHYLFEQTKSLHASKSGDVLISHFGRMHQRLIKELGSDLSEKLEALGASPRSIKRAYHVLVESLQNIVKHGDNATTGAPDADCPSAFLVGKQEDRIYFTTGNCISLERLQETTDALDHLATLDEAGIKAMYREQIRSGQITERGGAGLGFIDIVKKTGQPIHHRSEKVSDRSALLLMQMSLEA